MTEMETHEYEDAMLFNIRKRFTCDEWASFLSAFEIISKKKERMKENNGHEIGMKLLNRTISPQELSYEQYMATSPKAIEIYSTVSLTIAMNRLSDILEKKGV